MKKNFFFVILLRKKICSKFGFSSEKLTIYGFLTDVETQNFTSLQPSKSALTLV